MTDLEFLFVILAAVYVTQCVSWVAPHAKIYTRNLRGRWRAGAPEIELSAWSTKAVFAHLLPFSAGIILTEPDPLPLSPQGIVALAATEPDVKREDERKLELIRWEDCEKIAAHGDRIRAQGRQVYRAVSAPEAARLAHVLRSIAKLPLGGRATAIEKELKRRCDIREAQETYAAYGKASRWTGAFANLLFLILLVIVPLYILLGARVIQWFVLLIATLLTIVLATRSFRRAHRALYPEEKDARWSDTLTVALSPFAAMRANDTLSRNLLASFDPLAAAFVLFKPARFEEEAARVYRDIHFPAAGAPASSEDAQEALRWFREARHRTLIALIKKQTDEPARFLAAPHRGSQASTTYCPRCHAQFRIASGTCSDCQGVQLHPFSAQS